MKLFNILFPPIDLKILVQNKDPSTLLIQLVGPNIRQYAYRWTFITTMLVIASLFMVIPNPSTLDIIMVVGYLVITTVSCSIMLIMWLITIAVKTQESKKTAG